MKKIKRLGLVMLCLLTLPPRFGFSEEAVNPIDWNSISPTDIKTGELTPLPGMRSLRYKMACTFLPVRHCAANIELEWELSDGTKRTQAVMGDGEIVDSIQSIKAANGLVIVKVGYTPPESRKPKWKWGSFSYKWNKEKNSFSRVGEP